MRKGSALFSKHKKLVLGTGLFLLAVTGWGFQDDLFQVAKNLDIFATVYKEVNINYVDDINSTKLIKRGLDAMMESLDPYTEFVPESEIEDYKLHYISTQYGGIGAGVYNRDKKVIISQLFEGYPAQKADVRVGDQVLKINDVDLAGKSGDEVSALLKGAKGGVVKLLLKREDVAQPIVKNLLREEIKQPNVSYHGMLKGGIGYIKLDKFLENSGQEVQDALLDIKKNNPKGIVLDLRYNGGGILQEAVKIVNFFVPKGVEVVSQKGKVKEKNNVYHTQNAPIETELPLVVLVNSRSASASEIVAGALQDLDRAVIVGQRSYGKGLVQQTFSMPYNSLVKITISKYYVPSGRCIQALDYTHRKEDGTVVKVADSLIHEFKTKNGRSVFDGSGIYPDVVVKQEPIANITKSLITKMLVFNYANTYRNTHNQLPTPDNFNISDTDYSEFVKYLSGKDYSYSTQTERLLADLKTVAEHEKQLTEIKPEYDALKNKLAISKKNDLSQHQAEIKQILESELVTRFYYEKGRIEDSFKYDKELAAATQVIQNKPELASILKGEGNYKVIGKPIAALAAKKADNDN
ncbi:S41 family peptidase [Mucilaginibacter arboris]|uniref:PDZ domain-containing protein n=1 Tax=Mucilaginibacter arboris TaxID=2682090 RepID=A0A7K1SZW8_9SPHI|nr:S41 family peptidase [Mucilaginibacter arboris]MVN22862.1 PDZ domain-containing protein [Mucilaginibacter arboris]